MFSIPCIFVSMRINIGVQLEFGSHVCLGGGGGGGGGGGAQGFSCPYLIHFACILHHQ